MRRRKAEKEEKKIEKGGRNQQGIFSVFCVLLFWAARGAKSQFLVGEECSEVSAGRATMQKRPFCMRISNQKFRNPVFSPVFGVL